MLLAVWRAGALIAHSRSGLLRRRKDRWASVEHQRLMGMWAAGPGGVPERRKHQAGVGLLGGSCGAHSLQIVRRTDPPLTNVECAAKISSKNSNASECKR